MHNKVSRDVSETDFLYTDPAQPPLAETIASNRTGRHYHHHHHPKLEATESFSDRDYLFVVSRVRVVTTGVHYLNLSATKNSPELSQVGQADSDGANSVYGVTVKADYNMRHGFELLGEM